jgi:hypothetical protein
MFIAGGCPADGRLWLMQIQYLFAEKTGYRLLVAGILGRILGACSWKAVVEIVNDDTGDQGHV